MRVRVVAHSLLTLTEYPSSVVGPELNHVPAAGHNVYLQLMVAPAAVATLHGLSAEVTERRPLEHGAVGLGPGELKHPDFEIVLDAEPPIIRPVMESDSRPSRDAPSFPLRLVSGSINEVVLTPITDDRGNVLWRLLADLECNGYRQVETFQLQVTAETRWRTFYPDDRSPKDCKAWEVVQHWHTP